MGLLICFIKLVLVFPVRQANNFSRDFLWYGLHLLPLFLRLCSCHTMKFFLQHDLEIVLHSWVTTFVHLQFLRLGTFSLGRRLEGKCDFAAYQPMISVAMCTGHSLWRVVRFSCHAAESERSPGGASVRSVGVSILPLSLIHI